MVWACARLAGSVLGAAVATLATVGSASAQVLAPSPMQPGVARSAAVSCGVSYPGDNLAEARNFPANTVTLRSGPSNSCIQTGQGTHDQLAQYLCYVPGDGGTWTFLRNVSTGDQGWVRDALLAGYGSDVPCEENPPPAVANMIRTPAVPLTAFEGPAAQPANALLAGLIW